MKPQIVTRDRRASSTTMRIQFLVAAAPFLFACNNKPGGTDATPTGSQASALGYAPPPGGSGHPHGMPPEALAACATSAADAACTMKMGEKEMTGKCAAGPDGKLACRPEGGQGHGGPREH